MAVNSTVNSRTMRRVRRSAWRRGGANSWAARDSAYRQAWLYVRIHYVNWVAFITIVRRHGLFSPQSIRFRNLGCLALDLKRT